MVDKSPENVIPFIARSQGRGQPKIDVGNHHAARRALQSILQSQRMAIASKTFRGGEMAYARVLFGGEYYDVDQMQLERLMAGETPADLCLEPAVVEDED